MKVSKKNHFDKSYLGNYKDIPFRVKSFGRMLPNFKNMFSFNSSKSTFKDLDIKMRECWVYYVYINIDKIPREYCPDGFWLKPTDNGWGSPNYKYYDHVGLGQIYFHEGMTWYSKESNEYLKGRIIKIGCDYQHAFDEEFITLNDIIPDIEKTIDSFYQIIPNYGKVPNEQAVIS